MAYNEIDNFYKTNKTTELIGKQVINTQDTPQKAELAELMAAVYADPNPDAKANPTGWHSIDFYLLGVMHGKQLERQRRKQ